MGSVLRRFEVKDRTAGSTCRGYVRDAGLRSTAGQALFVVLCLTPVLQKKRPVDTIVYEGSEDIGDDVRFLARTYTDPSTTLPRVVATADHSHASENDLWVRIDKDGALYTLSRGRVGRGNDRAEKVPPFKQLREDPVGGWMLVPGMCGDISLASAVPRWTLENIPKSDTAVGDWADAAVTFSQQTADNEAFCRRWRCRFPFESTTSRVLIDPAPRQSCKCSGPCQTALKDINKSSLCDSCRVTRVCDPCGEEARERRDAGAPPDPDATGFWACKKCRDLPSGREFYVHQCGNQGWAFSDPVVVRDGHMYEFDGAQNWHDVVAFSPDVTEHVVRYSFVLQREMSVAEAEEVGERTIQPTPFEWGDVSREALLDTLRELPYQTWLSESREDGTTDYPSAWVNAMLRTQTGGSTWDAESCLTAADKRCLDAAMKEVKTRSAWPRVKDCKLVVNAMSTAWPFTMGGHTDTATGKETPHVLASTLVLVDKTGPIVTLAGLAAKIESTWYAKATATLPACAVRHYAQLVRKAPTDETLAKRCVVLATDGSEHDGTCLRLVKAGAGPLPETSIALENDQWNALNERLNRRAAIRVVVRVFVENSVVSASVSFWLDASGARGSHTATRGGGSPNTPREAPEGSGSNGEKRCTRCDATHSTECQQCAKCRAKKTTYRRRTRRVMPPHPAHRPCPLPNETNGEEEADRTENGRDQARRNAYLQLLTNEAGLYTADAEDVPPKLRPYVRELARYQTNPLEVPIVSLRELDGGKRSFTEFVRQVWGDHAGCPFVLRESEHTASTAGDMSTFFQGQEQAVFVELSPPWGEAERSTIEEHRDGYNLTGVLSRANAQSICRVLRRGQTGWYRCSDREVTVESPPPRFRFQEGEEITGLVWSPAS